MRLRLVTNTRGLCRSCQLIAKEEQEEEGLLLVVVEGARGETRLPHPPRHSVVPDHQEAMDVLQVYRFRRSGMKAMMRLS